ncbi:CrcB family protein [Planococcus sp. N028]|uniref:Fluoride-specific ion channel FluC n=1 Tax=Planococcus shixiaomingii TaxID=3058393 RepID=A0ABT8N626_9BACL|nr:MULTISPECIES: CrcB family protein [unclassified Planococcus (in: firmicutes)]MDN7243340.1 CrcB family protein [Planococcus sp. N028]WKA55282.1 CrcB family protein [Planococcus sp. N022]
MISIAAGGFLGAIARYLFYLFVESKAWQPKVATWLVNSMGSLALGIFMGNGQLSVFWITGFLGAFTTFSTLALDVVKDLEDGKWRSGLAYAAATLFSGIVLFSIGYTVV